MEWPASGGARTPAQVGVSAANPNVTTSGLNRLLGFAALTPTYAPRLGTAPPPWP